MRRKKPNLRIHLRGGQTIETRVEELDTSKTNNNDLTRLATVGLEPGWPKLHYVRLDSVDAIEWIQDA